jgi:1,4-dihydroxy-2-naphthoate octaprenyltransferase
VYLWVSHKLPASVLLVLLSGLVAVRLIQDLYRKSGSDLNKSLADTGRFELIYAILFSVAMFLS